MPSTATRASEPTQNPKKERSVKNKIYDLIGPTVREDMALVGYRVDEKRVIDPRQPHLEVLEMSFVGGKKVVRTFQVDPHLGRKCPEVTWVIGDREFVVHAEESEGSEPRVFLIAEDGEQEVEVEDDGETIVIFRRSGSNKRKQVCVVKVEELYVEIGWDLTAPVLVYGDALRTLGSPGTCRFRPIEGKTYPLVVCYDYADVAIGRGPKVKRRFGKAFPLYPEELGKDEYTPAPSGKEPMKWNLTFYPVLLGRKDNLHVVPLTIDNSSGKRVMIDRGFELEDHEWGREISCLVREGKRDLNAIPDRRSESGEGKVAFEAFQESAGRAMAEFEAEQIELADDEFVHAGVKLKVYDALAKYKITPDSTRKQVEGARKRMERELHPDTSKQLKAYRDAGISPPASLVKSINESAGKFRVAFHRLLLILTEQEELAKKAGEEVDLDDPKLLTESGEDS